MLLVQKKPPDDELVCSKYVEECIIETNKGNRVCIWLVILSYICVLTLNDVQEFPSLD